MGYDKTLIYLAIPEKDLQFVLDSLDKVSGTRRVANALEVALSRGREEQRIMDEEE